MQKLKDSDLAKFECLPDILDASSRLQWAEDIALNFWEPVKEELEKLPLLDVLDPAVFWPLVKELPADQQWYRLTDKVWERIEKESLPHLCILDIESTREKLDDLCPYLPFLCIILGGDGHWYGWSANPKNPPKLIPFPSESRIVLGHNIVSYDRRYLSSEYGRKSTHWYVDTLAVASRIFGTREDEGTNDLYKKYKVCQSIAERGLGTPEWFQHVSTLGLEELSKRVLKRPISKAVRHDLTTLTGKTLYNKIQCKSVQEYCAQDVYTTFLLFGHLFPIALNAIPSPVSWVGLLFLSRSTVILKDWEEYLAEADEQERCVICHRRGVIRKLMIAAIASPKDYPEFDWSLSNRSKDGKKLMEREDSLPSDVPRLKPYKWVLDIESAKVPRSLSLKGVQALMKLRWKGVPIISVREGKQNVYYAGDEQLPHPTYEEGNLGSLFCKGYAEYFEKGVITSDLVPQETLIQMVEGENSLSQWKGYKSRFKSIYSLESEWGLQTICDINPTGTLSGRVTSNLWVVLPKPPKKGVKVGANVMRHIGAPKGMRVVYADFSTQELNIAAHVGDAWEGKRFSCEWTKAVLTGDKDLGTDLHSIVAKEMEFERDPAKFVNFSSIYGGSEPRVSAIVNAHSDLGKEKSQEKAKQFMNYLKGPKGIAFPVFKALKSLTTVPDFRSPILRVKIPNSINYRWSQKDSVTTRQNWTIQTSGVDQLHLLLTILNGFLEEREINAFFMLSIHDSVFFAVEEGKEEEFTKLLQSSHYYLQMVCMEQISRNIPKYRDPFSKINPSKIPVLECPEGIKFFQEVENHEYLKPRTQNPAASRFFDNFQADDCEIHESPNGDANVRCFVQGLLDFGDSSD